MNAVSQLIAISRYLALDTDNDALLTVIDRAEAELNLQTPPAPIKPKPRAKASRKLRGVAGGLLNKVLAAQNRAITCTGKSTAARDDAMAHYAVVLGIDVEEAYRRVKEQRRILKDQPPVTYTGVALAA